MLEAAVLCPIEAEAHTKCWVQPSESPLTSFVMEDASNKPELPVAVAKSVTMSEIERLVSNLKSKGIMMKDDTAFLLQVVEAPNVVIASEIVNLDAHIGQLAHLTQEAREAFGHYSLVLEPEVEHIAKHIDSSGFILNLIEETNQPAFLLAAVLNGQAAQMSIC
jgi:hypothetical protein